MSGYQRVEDLETMQIDDTIHMMGDGRSKRSFLDQIIYREHSYDPRVMGQRTVMIGLSLITAAALSLVALTIVLSMASSARMGARVEHKPDSIRYGLQLIPDLHQLSNGMLVYSTSLDANATRQRYVDGINEFLDTYVNEQISRKAYMVDCAEGQTAPNKWCRFDTTRAFQKEGRGCTRYDNFGYDTGSPCVLFALKDEIQWAPKVASNVTEIPFKCDIKPLTRSSKPSGAFYFPSHNNDMRLGAFPTNKLPSRTINDPNGNGPITDEDGEMLYDTPSLVFVKLALPEVKMQYTISCGLKDDIEGNEVENLADFRGRKVFTFDVVVN